ncbi:uncharacterized MFS-type transporter C09D4.1-like [Neocloeon triangulifer]|uniref:uncharacterized MFS-type transporter C09D4.1-like n=1 Tax=Neocloeon triangulifer TaxID=2078957 RepID=UPI00286EF415|nr:uncharacterized MFS-type transporter C09D4.1-like [Neocloeon triangulifer]
MEEEYKVYKSRWLILGLYSFYCAVNAMQWLQYSIIAEVIEQYYHVSITAVNWTSIIYMVAYVVTILPATWFFNKMGIRVSILLAMGGTCLGSWVKVLSVAPDRFWVTFLGQTIVALSQMYVFSIATPLAATWFGPSQVSTACSIGVTGLMLGNALGMWMPTALVPTEADEQKVAVGLSTMFYINAVSSSVIFILQLIFLKSRPPSPPSSAEAVREASPASVRIFLKSLWRLLKDRNYFILFTNFSLNAGVFSAISTYLGQIISIYYQNGQDDAGYIGFIFIVAGMVSMPLVGIILDRTKLYKETLGVIYLTTIFLMIAFTFVMPVSILSVYISSAVLGFFLIGYLPAAFELAVEITYPESEASSSGCMALGGQISSVIISLAYGAILEASNDVASNCFLAALLAVGMILVFFIKSDLKRQKSIKG